MPCPCIRKRIDEDLARRACPATRCSAAVVRLLDETLIRIGNDEYAEENDSYGLTTLQDDHADDRGLARRSSSSGPSPASSRRSSSATGGWPASSRPCQDLPGEELFQYLDDDGDGGRRHLGRRERVPPRASPAATFTAKDFRTWGGTVVAAEALVELGPPTPKTDGQAEGLAAIDVAAERLGNTRAVCRELLRAPAVTEAYADGHAVRRLAARPGGRARSPQCEARRARRCSSDAAD